MYSTSADPSTVLGWYRTQMSGWTAYFDHTGTYGGYTWGMLLYVKGSDAAAIGVWGTATGTEIVLFYLPTAMLPASAPSPQEVASGTSPTLAGTMNVENIPVYTGATASGMTNAQLETLMGQSLPRGVSFKSYSTSAGTSTVIDWYKTKMTDEGWTKYFDNTSTFAGYNFGILIYTKGNDAAAIVASNLTGNEILLLCMPRKGLPPASQISL